MEIKHIPYAIVPLYHLYEGGRNENGMKLKFSIDYTLKVFSLRNLLPQMKARNSKNLQNFMKHATSILGSNQPQFC